MATHDDLDDVVKRERSRLRSFIRRRVPDPRDAEDILQDVFSRAGGGEPPADADRSRHRLAVSRRAQSHHRSVPRATDEPDSALAVSSRTCCRRRTRAGAGYARTVLLDALEQAIAELPPEQRDVFVAHELEGRSFKEMAAATGVSVNTLLSRKRYAVLRLRERLRSTYDDMTKP